MWKKFKRFYFREMYVIECNGAAIGGMIALMAYGGFYLLGDVVNMIMEIVGG